LVALKISFSAIKGMTQKPAPTEALQAAIAALPADIQNRVVELAQDVDRPVAALVQDAMVILLFWYGRGWGLPQVEEPFSREFLAKAEALPESAQENFPGQNLDPPPPSMPSLRGGVGVRFSASCRARSVRLLDTGFSPGRCSRGRLASGSVVRDISSRELRADPELREPQHREQREAGGLLEVHLGRSEVGHPTGVVMAAPKQLEASGEVSGHGHGHRADLGVLPHEALQMNEELAGHQRPLPGVSSKSRQMDSPDDIHAQVGGVEKLPRRSQRQQDLPGVLRRGAGGRELVHDLKVLRSRVNVEEVVHQVVVEQLA
jgi:hypothetical protein